MGIWANFLTGAIALSLGYMSRMPPAEYTKNSETAVSIVFTDPLLVHLKCGGKIFEGPQILGCAGIDRPWALMPNPCPHSEESYARLLCHELGHTKGWPADHPNAILFGTPIEAPKSPQNSDKKPL